MEIILHSLHIQRINNPDACIFYLNVKISINLIEGVFFFLLEGLIILL